MRIKLLFLILFSILFSYCGKKNENNNDCTAKPKFSVYNTDNNKTLNILLDGNFFSTLKPSTNSTFFISTGIHIISFQYLNNSQACPSSTVNVADCFYKVYFCP